MEVFSNRKSTGAFPCHTEDAMWKYNYQVPEQKQIRYIVYTDCANEADDQYTLAHALMTPLLDVRGIIAAHFNRNTAMEGFPIKPGETAKASKKEIERVLDLMGLQGKYPVFLGSGVPLENETEPQVSPGAQFIIQEAMRDDERPLYIGCMGSVTDLASALLIEPKIASRITAIWIGGGDYPKGGFEFNLMQDPHAANVLFSSTMPLWQVTMKVYKSFSVSLAELQYKVAPCGEIGKYLFENMVNLNNRLGFAKPWPHGEIWGLGDSGVIAAVMQEYEKNDNYREIPAPNVDVNTLEYRFDRENRPIRVYESLDTRLTLEDFFAKLAINYRQ